MTSKFGEIKINSIGPGIQVLRRDNFDNKITEVFRIDGNRFNQPARLATFDSIHDFKTFGTNPTDTIEYQRKEDGKYNINKCFFNFNRIMCRGALPISVENSFLTKPKGQNPGQGPYDNKPYPITTIANVEDYFCLLNLYSAASEAGVPDGDLRIIKGTPKTKESGNDIDTHNNITNTNFKNITEFIVQRGWCDIVGDKAYINTVTDVSPAFRKYYIQNESHNNVLEIPNRPEMPIIHSVSYRAIISQETANDPAGSLGQSILTSAFGASNILVEKPGQSRTYDSNQINSFFEPTLNGITELTDNITDRNYILNFDTKLTLVDESANPLAPISVVIPYAKAGTANPNERTIINKDINKEFPGITKKNVPTITSLLNGRDTPEHSQARAFYSDEEVDSFSKEESQKQIARHFTRKRFGDVLQASLCRLINSKYTDSSGIDDDGKRIKFTLLNDRGSFIVPESAIFIGEDRMIIAYCLINKIPCIYDNKNYTILYMPQRPIMEERPMYSQFATINPETQAAEQAVEMEEAAAPENPESNTNVVEIGDAAAPENSESNTNLVQMGEAAAPENSESEAVEMEEAEAPKNPESEAVEMEEAEAPKNPESNMETIGGGMNFNKDKQTGGSITRSDYRTIYINTMWNEPYYFYKYLFFIKNIPLLRRLNSIDKKLIDNTYQGNVFNLSDTISSNPKEIPMYYVCPYTEPSLPDSYPPESGAMLVVGKKRGRDETEQIGRKVSRDDSGESVVTSIDDPIFVAQKIIDTPINTGINQYTFINVFNENTYDSPTPRNDNPQILLSVTQEQEKEGSDKYKDVYFKTIDGRSSNIKKILFSDFKRYFETISEINENTIINREDDYYRGGKVYNPNAKGLDDYHMQIEGEPQQEQPNIQQSENTDLYNKNVKALQYYFDVLNKYELYSIMDEASEVNFYDINGSGVRVAYDCLFYVVFNKLVNDFEEQSNKVSYELLVYYLFQNNKDLYYEFDEIISFGSEEKINVDETILQSLTSQDPVVVYTLEYFKNVLEVSINKRDEINNTMYTMFTTNNFIGQYNCAIENKFTHYGFTTIQQDFEAIIQNNIPTPSSTSTFTPSSTSTQSPYIDNSIGSKTPNTPFSQINTPPTLSANAGGEKTRKYKKPLKYKRVTYKKNKRVTHNKTKKNKGKKSKKGKSKKVKK
jgi:hypothetical protein